jgi:uncharacterized protein YidB (DUF937 family)
MRRHMRKITFGAAALVAVAGGGGAIAATQLTPKQESQAVLSDAADELGVEASELTEALQKALSNRVDAAVADGRLTEAQGEAMKQRIASGDFPLVGLGGPGFGRGGPHHHHAGLGAAASFLGMTEAKLRTALGSGQTLAQLAKARGKSVDGLVAAMTKAEIKELDAAVKAGRLSDADRDSIVATLKDRITDIVNGVVGPRFGRGHAGEPPAEMGSAA